jgi:hypothetical protein
MSNAVAKKQTNGDVPIGHSKTIDENPLQSSGGNNQVFEPFLKFPDPTIRQYPYYIPQFATDPGSTEWQCRIRRTELFGKTTGLRAVKTQAKRRLAEIERIKRHIQLDHVSTWESDSSALFILNETYHYTKAEIAALEQAGYEVRIVPTNLAPYCGRFDSAKGAKPWTTSLLITRRENSDELDSIHLRLLAEEHTASDWNT